MSHTIDHLGIRSIHDHDDLAGAVMLSCCVRVAHRLVNMGEACVGAGLFVTVAYLNGEGERRGVLLFRSSWVTGGEQCLTEAGCAPRSPPVADRGERGQRLLVMLDGLPVVTVSPIGQTKVVDRMRFTHPAADRPVDSDRLPVEVDGRRGRRAPAQAHELELLIRILEF